METNGVIMEMPDRNRKFHGRRYIPDAIINSLTRMVFVMIRDS